MSSVAGYVLIGVMALLAIQEIIHYRRCQRDASEIPYPWRSLTRRLAITLDFIFLLLVVMFWPNTKPLIQLTLMGLIGLAALVGFFLLWRDLRETSLNVVEEASRLNENAGRELAQALKKKQSASGNPSAAAPESPSRPHRHGKS